jgi:hypothetical protein
VEVVLVEDVVVVVVVVAGAVVDVVVCGGSSPPPDAWVVVVVEVVVVVVVTTVKAHIWLWLVSVALTEQLTYHEYAPAERLRDRLVPLYVLELDALDVPFAYTEQL